MKRVFIVLVLIVVGVAALGLYRGWFHVASDSDAGKRSVTVSMDQGKIEEDKDKAVGKVEDAAHQAKESAAATTQKTKEQAAAAGAR